MLRAGLVLEPLDDQVRVAADAERAEVELVGILLRIGHQLLEVLHRDVLVEDQHLLREGEVGDRLEILQRIVGQVLVERRIERHRAARQQADGGAVGSGAALQALAAMMVLAPGRLSTTKPCGLRCSNALPSARTITSMAPPGASGMMHPDRGRRIARPGQGRRRDRTRSSRSPARRERPASEASSCSSVSAAPCSRERPLRSAALAERASCRGWPAGAVHCTIVGDRKGLHPLVNARLDVTARRVRPRATAMRATLPLTGSATMSTVSFAGVRTSASTPAKARRAASRRSSTLAGLPHVGERHLARR